VRTRNTTLIGRVLCTKLFNCARLQSIEKPTRSRRCSICSCIDFKQLRAIGYAAIQAEGK
jgi:hypothetical protein